MAGSSWQLQEAKARLSELVKRAEREGPQEITVHGAPAAVVLSARDYARLSGQQESLVDFIGRSPLKGANLTLKRDRRPARTIDL